MRITSHILLSGILLMLPASVAVAHHSAAAFNTQQEVKTIGTVVEYRFANPHVYIVLEVKNEDGSTRRVDVEAGAASVLVGLGFTKDSIKKGEVVTVVGNPGRKDPAGLVLGRELFRRDGTYIPLNIASRSVYASAGATAFSAAASTIAGTWFSPSSEFFGYMGTAAKWPLTDKARAAMKAAGDPTATTQKDCIPIGVPGVMFYPVANTITVRRDRVVMNVDWMGSERTIFLDGRQHPPAAQTSLHGHSVGRWDGDTLVVETTNFADHAMGLSTSAPSSAQKKVIERFRLGPDRRTLLYSGVVDDPVYLSKPAEWSGKWEYRPNMRHSNQQCDVEVARRFLKDL
jgi:hypothetical protein